VWVTNDKEFEETKMMGIWIVMMTALPHCFSSPTGRSQQGSILVLVIPLPVLLHPKRRGGDNMWTVLIMQCLLHCFSRQGSRVLVVLPPYFCIQQELGVDPSCFDED
jgi:hypothetical protein